MSREQYLSLSQSGIPDAKVDVSLSEKGQTKRYEMPVILQNCNSHPLKAYEFQVVVQAIKEKKFFECLSCHQKAYNINELKKDFRWLAYQEFNDLVQEITIINGFLFNKIQQKQRRVLNKFEDDLKFFLYDIFARNVQENSLNQLIFNQIRTNSQKIKNQKFYFWAFCLLEKVKITIPVRILNCQHIECYDLFSLIKYRQELQNTNTKIFECRMPGCSNKLKMSKIEELFSGIFVDTDLLNAIKKGNPSTYKFQFNPQTQKLEEQIFMVNGKNVDWMICQYYKKLYKVQDLDNNYFDFQRKIQEYTVLIITNDMEGKDSLKKFDTYKVQMIDPITQLPIEYPARCKICTDLTKCMDLRTLIAEFCRMKVQSPQSTFLCPLCKQSSGGQLATAQVNKLLYIDQNILSQIYKDQSYVQTGIFNYQGDQYMLQEFQDRQKIPLTEYIQKLTENNTNLMITYENLYCKFNQNKILEYPLILQQCSQKTVIDYFTFYEKLKEKNFDISSGIKFCNCENCNTNLIKGIQSNLYFHEGLFQVLQELKKQNIPIQKNKTYVYDFTKMEIVQSEIIIPNSDQKASEHLRGQEGFTSLLDDEEYQRFFAVDNISNYAFRMLQIHQEIADGLNVTHTANGVQANVNQKVEQINNSAQNSELSKWNFKMINMKVQLSSEIINSNRGEVQSKFY